MARSTSALGEYVHLTASKYVKHGTYRSSEGKSNYKSNVFSSLQKQIKKEIAALEIFKDSEALKKAQDAYNKNRQRAYETIKKWFENSQKGDQAFAKRFAEALLKAANITNLDADILTAILTFDEDESKNATARGVAFVQSALNSPTNDVKKITPFKGEEYTRFSTIEERYNLVQSKVEKLFGVKDVDNNAVIKEIQDRLKSIKKLIDEIRTIGNTTEKINAGLPFSVKSYAEGDSVHPHIRVRKSAIEVSLALSGFIFNSLQAIINSVTFTSVLKNVQAGFSEIMAGLSGELEKGLSEKNIFNYIDQTVMGTKKAKVIGPIQQMASDLSKKYDLKNDFFGIQATSNLASGKVDAVFTIDNIEAYASVKNYNLGQEVYYSKGKATIAAVSLVSGTPLTSLLFTADNFQKKIGTHFLNILSEKEDGGAQLATMRKAGIDTLGIFLIYMGLTGGSGKLAFRDQQAANLLVIEDKATKKAYFFNLSSILSLALQDLANAEKHFLLTAAGQDLSHLMLKNKRVQEHSSQSENIKMRLKNVLTEAHQIKLSAKLKNSSINAIIRKREN